MNSLEAKREQFRKYLERCGVIDALSKALIKLYEEPNKPDDAVRFVRKYMCESCPDDEAYEALKADFETASKTVQNLEEELERYKGNLKRTPSEIAMLLEEGFNNLQSDLDCQSLLKKHLKKEVYDQLATIKTPNGATLLDICQAGFACHQAKVGVFAADKDSYDVFEVLFDPIIQEYHGIQEIEQQPGNWGDFGSIQDLDPDNKYIKFTRIRVSRNLEGFPFFQKMTEDQFKEIEEKVKGVCQEMESEFKGTYYTMHDLDPSNQLKMIKKGILFKKGDPYLNNAGCFRFWPTGRGVFHNPAETFVVWVNNEDHVMILSMAKCGDLGDTYQRLVNGVKKLEENLQFQTHKSYGYVTASPTNLGTTLRASVHIKLENLTRDLDSLDTLCKSMQLQFRGLDEDGEKISDGVVEISNKVRMDMTEFDAIKHFQDSVLVLIRSDQDAEP